MSQFFHQHLTAAPNDLQPTLSVFRWAGLQLNSKKWCTGRRQILSLATLLMMLVVYSLILLRCIGDECTPGSAKDVFSFVGLRSYFNRFH